MALKKVIYVKAAGKKKGKFRRSLRSRIRLISQGCYSVPVKSCSALTRHPHSLTVDAHVQLPAPAVFEVEGVEITQQRGHRAPSLSLEGENQNEKKYGQRVEKIVRCHGSDSADNEEPMARRSSRVQFRMYRASSPVGLAVKRSARASIAARTISDRLMR